MVVDKDDNVWSTEKYYMKEGDEDQEYSMDDYVKDNYGAEKFMVEGQSYIGLPEKRMAGEAKAVWVHHYRGPPRKTEPVQAKRLRQ